MFFIVFVLYIYCILYVINIFKICKVGNLDIGQAGVAISFIHYGWLNSVLPLSATGDTHTSVLRALLCFNLTTEILARHGFFLIRHAIRRCFSRENAISITCCKAELSAMACAALLASLIKLVEGCSYFKFYSVSYKVFCKYMIL